ncbi:MAG: polysaccharide lyase 8 family protein [Clostridiales bacterium]|jgi:hyaluronate lyase|nr:polysaccharide lyase 8 family protein [Clostridiales bacterium]
MKRLVTLFLLIITSMPSAGVRASVDEFDLLREKWVGVLSGGGDYDTQSDVYQRRIAPRVAEHTAAARLFWERMVPSANRVNDFDGSFLWQDLQVGNTMDMYGRDSSKMSLTYSRLSAMALACVQKGSDLFGDAALIAEVIGALDWLYTYKYNENTPKNNRDPAAVKDNWYYWEISIPTHLNNIQAMLYEHLTAAQIANYQKGIDKQISTLGAAATGANRLSQCSLLAVGGIVKRDGDKLRYARDQISPALAYTAADDGFYPDGAFIQHHSVPYNSAYGLTALANLSNILYLLENTSYRLTDSNAANIYEWVENAFLPTSYEGRSMDSVAGRSIARAGYRYDFLETLTKLAFFAPEPKASYYKSVVKRWVEDNAYYDYYENISNIFTLSRLDLILTDSAVTRAPDSDFYKQFYNMERFVLTRPNYSFNAAMYSERIRNYESINGENTQGWHTGSGMTYLYNSDLAQYDDGYFATVDRYRLPGTTVVKHTTQRADAFTNHFAGGAEHAGRYGVSAMRYEAAEDTAGGKHTLTADKAWFMLDDEIVCLGADITSATAGDDIETVIENRKLNALGENRFTVNGVTKPQYPGYAESIRSVSWAHLEGNPSLLRGKAASGIGYYFPTAVTIDAKREARTDSWRSVNATASTALLTRNYLSMSAAHGTTPSGKTYAYVLLPDRSAEDTARYAANPDIEVVANDALAQAVLEKKNNLFGAVFRQNQRVAAGSVVCYNKAVVMTSDSGGVTEISVADPTRQNPGKILLELDGAFYGVESADPGVCVTQAGGKVYLSVSVAASRGKTFHARLYSQPTEQPPYWFAPEPPEGLTFSGGELRWSAVFGAAGYTVYRAGGAESAFEPLADVAQNCYTDTAFLMDTDCYYKVTAYGGGAQSEFSEVAASLYGKKQYLIDEDFDGFAVGEFDGGGWTFRDAPNSCGIVSVGDGDHVLKIYRISDTNLSTVSRAFPAPPAGGTLTIEAEVVPDGQPNDYKTLLAAGDGDGKAAVHVYSQKGSMYVYNGDTVNTKTTVLDGTVDVYRPYRLQAVIDTAARRFDLYVDGALKASGLRFRDSAAGIPSSVSFAPGNNHNTLTVAAVKVYYTSDEVKRNTLTVRDGTAVVTVHNTTDETLDALGVLVTYEGGRLYGVKFRELRFPPNAARTLTEAVGDKKTVFLLLDSATRLKPLIHKLTNE